MSFSVQGPTVSVHGISCRSRFGTQVPSMHMPQSDVPQAVPVSTGAPWHVPLTHVSLAVHSLLSSQVPPLIGVPAQVPAAQVSFMVQALPSSQVPPLIGVPAHSPPAHISGVVHSSESSQTCALTVAVLTRARTTATVRSFPRL
jgi:hypothetical protein